MLLCASNGCVADKETTETKIGLEVVLFANHKLIRTLTFCQQERLWIIQGYLSILSAEGRLIPEADFYHKNIGYICPPSIVYATLDDLSTVGIWEQLYNKLSEFVESPLAVF